MVTVSFATNADPDISRLVNFYAAADNEHQVSNRGVLSSERSREFGQIVLDIVKRRDFDQRTLSDWLHNPALTEIRALRTGVGQSFASIAMTAIAKHTSPTSAPFMPAAFAHG